MTVWVGFRFDWFDHRFDRAGAGEAGADLGSMAGVHEHDLLGVRWVIPSAKNKEVALVSGHNDY